MRIIFSANGSAIAPAGVYPVEEPRVTDGIVLISVRIRFVALASRIGLLVEGKEMIQ